MAAAREFARYKLNLVGVQEVRWDRKSVVIITIIIIIWIGVPVPLFAPWKYCSQCGLLYKSPSSKRSYSGRQVPLASTTCGSPLAARGGTMGEK